MSRLVCTSVSLKLPLLVWLSWLVPEPWVGVVAPGSPFSPLIVVSSSSVVGGTNPVTGRGRRNVPEGRLADVERRARNVIVHREGKRRSGNQDERHPALAVHTDDRLAGGVAIDPGAPLRGFAQGGEQLLAGRGLGQQGSHPWPGGGIESRRRRVPGPHARQVPGAQRRVEALHPGRDRGGQGP